MTENVPDLIPVLPEITLAIGGMALLMFGVFRGDRATGQICVLAIILFGLAFGLMFAGARPVETFGGTFILDGFAVFMKALVLIGSAIAVLLSGQYLADQNIRHFEYPVLLVLSTLGMLMMISANDMLTLYIGLELQSLCLYVLAAFNRDRRRSTEAGLKYFVLGALSSGLLLYGISLIYGFAGTTGFEALAVLTGADSPPIGVVIGLVFVLSGLAFKVSAVPFHMWTPDVYEGAPTPVTAFFAIAPKVAAMALLIRVVLGPFPGLLEEWRQIIVFVSIASMALGAFAALMQTNIKRLMAYSSIAHVGYALVGLAAGDAFGVQSVLIYMAVYLTMTAGAFALILSMRDRNGLTEDISDLAGLSKTRPIMALGMATLMFSLAGLPPLAGFFPKLFVFQAAVQADLVWLAIIGVLTSVVGAFYYLRIVRVIYFDEPVSNFVQQRDRGIAGVAVVAALINSPLIWLAIGPLVAAAGAAAQTLFS